MSRLSSGPLGNGRKLSFPVAPGMIEAVDAIARSRGVTRAEILRRMVARAIVNDVELFELPVEQREEIEYLAELPF